MYNWLLKANLGIIQKFPHTIHSCGRTTWQYMTLIYFVYWQINASKAIEISKLRHIGILLLGMFAQQGIFHLLQYNSTPVTRAADWNWSEGRERENERWIKTVIIVGVCFFLCFLDYNFNWLQVISVTLQHHSSPLSLIRLGRRRQIPSHFLFFLSIRAHLHCELLRELCCEISN